jgi:glycine dehydrogenase subunit 1
MVAELTGLDIANASLYDAATAITEACSIAINQTGRDRIAVAGGLNPQYRAVLETYMRGQGFNIVDIPESWTLDPEEIDAALDESVAGIIVQSPNFWGALERMPQVTELAHAHGALVVAVANPLSFAILAPPGEYGADIAVGCGQPFGMSLSYGGPYLGIMATRSGLERRLPGRIAGQTVDSNGKRGFVLTLQAREQHIRREKATSNICTNHQLMALAATVYLSLMGKQGIRELATQCVQRAHYAARRLAEIPGFALAFDSPYFNEFTLRTPVPASEVNRYLLSRGIVGGVDLGTVDAALGDCLLLAFTEMSSRQQIDDLVTTLQQLQPESAAEVVLGATGGVS